MTKNLGTYSPSPIQPTNQITKQIGKITGRVASVVINKRRVRPAKKARPPQDFSSPCEKNPDNTKNSGMIMHSMNHPTQSTTGQGCRSRAGQTRYDSGLVM